jgi:transposase
MPRLPGSAEVLENRRRRALKLLDKGHSINEVGRMLECAPSSVMRWRNVRRKKGEKGLKVKFSPGRPLKLNKIERRKLVKVLLRGAIAYGYSTELWTTARIAEVIACEFGVEYHRDHIGRLMHTLGWSHQKPERRASERNEEAIERWKKEEWPRIKKRLDGWGPT